jgi:hypothetical protein
MTALHHGLSIICATVIGVGSAPPFESGVVATYIELRLERLNHSTVLYLPYFAKSESIPHIGDKCQFYYRISPLDGFVGSTSLHVRKAKVVDTFKCDKLNG